MAPATPPANPKHFPNIGYVLECDCGYRAFNVVLSNPSLDDRRDVIGFVCLRCGDSMAFSEDQKSEKYN